MRKMHVLIGAALMMTSSGFAEVTKVPMGRKPIGSDVVVESSVRELKSIPKDTVNLVGDTIKIITDDVSAATRATASVFYGDEREKAAAKGAREVAAAWDTSKELHFRSYTVSDEIADLLMNGEGEPADPMADVRAFFTGIPFGKNASAYYMSSMNRLLVRQTMDNILAVEYVLADYQTATRELLGHQVEIEVKFVEVSQSTLDELGFSWTFNDNNGGPLQLMDDLFLPTGTSLLSDGLRAASGALNAAEPGMIGIRRVGDSLSWDLVINALEQAKDTDVLSAPRIVTLDGETATIEVGEERQVPKSFEVNQQNTSVYIEHSDWDLELMGVSLEVTPELRSDGLIRLELNPKVVDLLGYDNYQVTPSDAHMLVVAGIPHQMLEKQGIYPVVSKTVDGAFNAVGELYNTILGDETTLQETSPNGGWYSYHDNSRAWSKEELFPVPVLGGQLPYFRVREIETSVTVADGSTVGMGGLIYDKKETFKDKVPVLGSIPLLGRLFRSEGERSIKRNLMIFVTATQVDVNGRRVVDMNLAN